jgi:hypothetical protein
VRGKPKKSLSQTLKGKAGEESFKMRTFHPLTYFFCERKI